jgi:hypothetical protein
MDFFVFHRDLEGWPPLVFPFRECLSVTRARVEVFVLFRPRKSGKRPLSSLLASECDSFPLMDEEGTTH